LLKLNILGFIARDKKLFFGSAKIIAL